ncbi:restriction endonuclease subunit S [Streptomyces microflavus]|uniref:restriction endonuclease subunit S n=1 Tax=Streptomyces microflavus TaxID=1919 RepID=UPI0033A634D5
MSQNLFTGLPESWGTTRLDRVATVNARIGWKALTAAEYQSSGYAFLATPNIKTPKIDFENVNYISKFRFDESPELKLRNGDVLLTKDGNTLGIVNIITELQQDATVNGSIAILRTSGIDPRFLRFVIASSVIQGHISSVKDGMGVPHLFQRDIKRFQLPLPPQEEQQRISDFLDIETARIDELSHLRRIQMILMRESLSAESAQLTGRNRVNSTLETRDYVVQLRRAISTTQTGSTPVDLRNPADDMTRDDLPWYTPAAIDGWLSVSDANKITRKGGDAPIFPAGSVIVTGIGESLGKVGYLPHTATGNQQLTALSPKENVSAKYIAWQLWAAQPEIREWAQYSRIRIINNDTLKAFPIFLPPRPQQDAVVSTLDSHLAKVQQLEAATIRFLGLANERRQALITAAVTGQFDVSTASGRGVTDGVQA